ncbi:MAG: adenosylmethionine decarboxylase [Deltaproteobacteria bacterium]|nr:MAG: adenosylmethionine decarboxylase [Deltaproteobacteria bacterium]
MFFEGSEKKVEVTVTEHAPNLRSLGHDFWTDIVEHSRAEIISSSHNDACDAYVLSESSLFVWDRRFLMITCGETTLVDGVLRFLQEISASNIALVRYQRKNEYRPRLQPSSFEDDIARLHQVLPGKAFRVGYLDSHYYNIFHTAHPYQAHPDDTVCELLMYHICGPVADYLKQQGQTREGVRERLQLHKLFEGYQLDDHVFEPVGYSLNAIRGPFYATLHVTPQTTNSYVSFETNNPSDAENNHILSRLLELLQPVSWNVMGFNCQPVMPERPNMMRLGANEWTLDCGYRVLYHHYQQSDQCDVYSFDL